MLVSAILASLFSSVEGTNGKNYYSFIKFLTPELFRVFNLVAIFLVLKRDSGKVWAEMSFFKKLLTAQKNELKTEFL